MPKVSARRPFSKNAGLGVRRPFFFKKNASTLCVTTIFSASGIVMSMIKQHLIKLTLNKQISVYLKLTPALYFISFLLLNKQSNHKFWPFKSRSRKPGFCVPGSVWCVLPEWWMPFSTRHVLSKAFEAGYMNQCRCVAWFVVTVLKKLRQNICNETAINDNFHFSHCKSMEI